MAKAATKKAPRAPLDNRQLAIVWLCALGVVIFIGGLWAWYQYVHRSSYNVFWAMVDNNLRTRGVTRTTEQTSSGSKVISKSQLSLGSPNLVKGLTTIKQDSGDGTTVVVTETLGTPTANFARYLDIQSPAKKDVSSIKNVWGREVLVGGEQQNQSVFAEALFSSIPFANLTQAQRQELVKYMQDKKVYTVDYRGAKTVDRGGKQGFEYSVAVNLKEYITVLKKIDQMMGLKQLERVDPAQYEGAQDARLTVVSSIDGRQLLEVSYDGADRKETYSGYGAHVAEDLPTTDVLRSDLEKKVQQLFAPTSGGE